MNISLASASGVAFPGSITNADVQKIMSTSKTTAYRLLTQLDEWLDTHGMTGKGTYYTFKGFKITAKNRAKNRNSLKTKLLSNSQRIHKGFNIVRQES